MKPFKILIHHSKYIIFVAFCFFCFSHSTANAASLTLKLQFGSTQIDEIKGGNFILETFKVDDEGETNGDYSFRSRLVNVNSTHLRNKIIKLRLVDKNAKKLRLAIRKPVAATISFLFAKNRTKAIVAKIWLERCNRQLCKNSFHVFIPPRVTAIPSASKTCSRKNLKNGPINSKEAAKMYSVCQAGYKNHFLRKRNQHRSRTAAGWHRSTTKLVTKFGTRGRKKNQSNYRLDRIVKEYVPLGKANYDKFQEHTGLPQGVLKREWKNAIKIDQNMIRRANRKKWLLKKTCKKKACI